GSGQYVGGLVADNDGPVTACYATGAVSGSDDVGGLVGRNGYYEPTTVTQCYATGAVSGSGQYVGGLVAENDGTVTACYAMGTVAGSDDVGGLVGKNNATVTQCYATGAVSGSGQYVGGLVGGHFGTVDSSYWDTETSGQATSADGTGEPTAAMMAQATFAGWDFTNIWDITEGKTYPCLRIGIPDVVGMTQSAAQAAITNAGLTVGTVTQQPSATVPEGEVISQSPVAETQVASGSAVDLVVSSGPPMQISVPYVTGMTQSAAQTAITNASLIVGTVSLEYSDTVSAEDVISQNPAADTSVAPSTPVNLTVSRGPQLTVGCFGGTTNNTSFGSPTGKNGDTVLLLSVSAGLCLVGSRRQRRLSLQ
ncbi:MAG: PASTA domain-containing protein, partial [Candidatus Hydrogenedentes bacterium]|nr:PASTA domain-containing protein [Candidatus Hydrogenedentota bacterium]